MSAPAVAAHSRAALVAVAEALDRVADALRLLSEQEPPAAGPRLVATTREPETLVSLDTAAEILGVSRATVERMTKGKPCRRRAGRRVLIERAGLLALTRRG